MTTTHPRTGKILQSEAHAVAAQKRAKRLQPKNAFAACILYVDGWTQDYSGFWWPPGSPQYSWCKENPCAEELPPSL